MKPASQRTHNVLILGLGAMGSAAAYHLARRGRRVLGVDRFTPPHAFGSSHGQTRIIREAYYEHPAYVPLVQRAYECWSELEQDSGQALFQQTGGLMLGVPDSALVQGSRRSAETHLLAHEIIDTAETRRRFPALRPPAETVALLEYRAGVLFPERCIEAHLALARKLGADLRFDTPVLRWEAEGDGVAVITANERFHADRLLLSAGAWTAGLLPELSLPLEIERQVLFWFEPSARRDNFLASRLPIFVWEYEPERLFYGFPDLGDGFKVARHYGGEPADPDHLRREVEAREVEGMRELLQRFLPDADGRLLATAVCMYTNTPDRHFLIDAHPNHPQVWIASPCSGHGFKFSSAVGELLADLLIDGTSRFDLSMFRLRRPWTA